MLILAIMMPRLALPALLQRYPAENDADPD